MKQWLAIGCYIIFGPAALAQDLSSLPIEFRLALERAQKRAIPEKITGGRDAEPSEYPWQVALLNSADEENFSAQFCGGAYIGESLIVTAAHCVSGLNSDNISVLSGTSMLDGCGIRTPVSAIFVYEGYEKRSGPSPGDVALLRTATDLAIPKVIIASSSETYERSASVLVTGWGLTDPIRANSKSVKLKEASLPTQATDICNRPDVYDGGIKEGMMVCAGSHSGGADSCLGDSGGPVTIGAGSNRRLVAVVSWGRGCGNPKQYGVYQQLSYYESWIAGLLGSAK